MNKTEAKISLSDTWGEDLETTCIDAELSEAGAKAISDLYGWTWHDDWLFCEDSDDLALVRRTDVEAWLDANTHRMEGGGA